MGRAGRPQFDDEGVAVVFVQDVKKNFYKKFLYEPFPVESRYYLIQPQWASFLFLIRLLNFSLLKVLADHLNAEIVAGTVTSKQTAIDYLMWTYLFRRLLQNPSWVATQSYLKTPRYSSSNLKLINFLYHLSVLTFSATTIWRVWTPPMLIST